VAATALFMFWAGFAAAADIRYPRTGPVAFDVHLANGWSANPDTTRSLNLTAPDNAAAISLTLEQQSASKAARTLDQIANQVLTGNNTAAFKKEPASIGEIAAEAYYSQILNSGSVPLQLRLILAKPLRKYLASELIVSRTQLNDAEQASLDAMMKSIQLTGAK